jgi:hypothetical protein
LCKKNIQLEEVTVQGEKAGCMPPLLHTWAEDAEVAPTSKSGREVICVYGPPNNVAEKMVEYRKSINR